MKIPKLPLPPKPLTEGGLYCTTHKIALDDNGVCVACEWAKEIKKSDK